MDNLDVICDAEDYVNSIMSNSQISKIETPINTSRKRHRTSPGDSIDSIKKPRNITPGNISPDCTLVGGNTSNARRSLYDKEPPTPAPRKLIAQADVHVSANTSIEKIMQKMCSDVANLSSEIQLMYSSFETRLDKLESGLEKRISNKVAQMIDKRMNSEVSKSQKSIESKIELIRDEVYAQVNSDIDDVNQKVTADLDDIKSRIVGISESGDTVPGNNELNIVIRNLPEHNSENIVNKVKTLMREGVKLPNVDIVKAVRKRASQGSNKPGVVVASLKSREDKKPVLSSKNKLKHNTKYSRVYIHSDMSKSDRIIADNVRTIISAFKSKDSSLSLKGSRVVKSVNQQASSQGNNDVRNSIINNDTTSGNNNNKNRYNNCNRNNNRGRGGNYRGANRGGPNRH
ncbi:hypothetical protein ACF0H5_012116 [Mactra antiquata]